MLQNEQDLTKTDGVDQQQEDLLKIRMVDWLDADAKIDLVGVKEGIFKDDMLILSPISCTYSDETQDRT